jgi:hypothetical protein
LPTTSCPNLRKQLFKLGFPKSDMRWAKLAAHACVQFLLTEDIDFYDPKRKGTRNCDKLKDDRSGAVLKLIKKDAGCEVISGLSVISCVGGRLNITPPWL